MRLPPNEDSDKHKRPPGMWSGESRLPSQSRPQSLDDLLVHAEVCAGETLRKTGRLVPTCFMLTPGGVIPVMAGSFADDRDKN